MSTVEFDVSKIKALAEQAVGDGIEDFVREDVAPDAQEHCPKDTGALAATESITRTGNETELSYGDGLDYAEIVYMRADLRHDPPEEDHWIERAYERQAANLEPRVAARVNATLK